MNSRTDRTPLYVAPGVLTSIRSSTSVSIRARSRAFSASRHARTTPTAALMRAMPDGCADSTGLRPVEKGASLGERVDVAVEAADHRNHGRRPVEVWQPVGRIEHDALEDSAAGARDARRGEAAQPGDRDDGRAPNGRSLRVVDVQLDGARLRERLAGAAFFHRRLARELE